ncbi:MAG: PhnD/SsuA/transferrin family substrate-binding protein [Oscillospiraceae bacterium]
MLRQGYDIGEVVINVGTTYEAVGEALGAGTADVGLIPGGTYVLYDDGCDVILTATRDGLSKDFDDAKDWNDGQPTEASDKQAVSLPRSDDRRSSDKGQALTAKVNAGEELTWDDLNGANWSVMGSSSPPVTSILALWLQDHYGKGHHRPRPARCSPTPMPVPFARLASGQVDVLVTYADARRDYAERWNTEFNREGSIWEETGVIGVTAPIYNDTVSVSKSAPNHGCGHGRGPPGGFHQHRQHAGGQGSHRHLQPQRLPEGRSPPTMTTSAAAQQLIQELSAAN